MKFLQDSLRLSASDLASYLNCRHLAGLEMAVAAGDLERPKIWDPLLEALWERGAQHEKSYVDYLQGQGFDVVSIEGIDITPEAVADTLAAMQAGRTVIVQGALLSGNWAGRPDILRRVEVPSAFGPWSYEPIDTKLARQTKGGTILQLCLYAQLLAEAQGTMPELMHVVAPWTDFAPQHYRVADFGAYYRHVKTGFEASLAKDEAEDYPTYPDPTAHCEICRWRFTCDQRRRDDDHLCLVAGISKLQITELGRQGINTTEALAAMPLPLTWKPERGSVQAYIRIREQARMQLQARQSGELGFEIIETEAGFGLSCLPEPSATDIFLDFEGDPFVGECGLEYLIGYHFDDENGGPQYVGRWALNREQEKAAFEGFIDFVMDRWERHPELHIYHFGGYESGALKRLMGRYATREDELDRILRGKLLVDLLGIVRQGIRAGVESYSIKKLEPLYGFQRDTKLPDANLALTRLQTSLELDDGEGITQADHATVESYNRDDCISTRHLRDWLEQRRAELIERGVEVSRAEPGDGAPGENVAAWLERIAPLVAALSEGVPADPADRTREQHGRWILANLLDWHRREDKAVWWELFRLSDLSAEDLLEERAGLGALTLVATVGRTPKCPIHRYRFPPQETDIRPGKDLRSAGGQKLGKAEAISFDELTIDIKKRADTAAFHPQAAFVHEWVDSLVIAEARVRLAEYVVERGLEGEGPYQAARDLLLRLPPRVADGSPMQLEGETTLDAGRRIGCLIGAGILPIQGPPGTGKTFTGGHMICELVRQGKRVGVVANSHDVIRNLLDKVIEAAHETGTSLHCVQKPKAKEPDSHRLRIANNADELFAALRSDCQVAGGTAWLWAAPNAFETVDVLFVDEAAQMSLANALAVAQAAKTVVLLGDPRQLDQPMQGSHPEGTDCSALDHVLDGRLTISPEQGLFLGQTWRLHPGICSFTSELFYEGKLTTKDGLELQTVCCEGPAGGAGLRYLPIEHTGNQNCSPEEADAIAALVPAILAAGATWTDRHGQQRVIGSEDILIIAPYNAQVFEIRQRLPGARVGTVDKFQGQEAPIAIYSLATSSHADAPRGMEFLYSLNRLNVATSRARCVSIVVGSPKLFEAECRTPRQMQLANAFCRYLEIVGEQAPPPILNA
jgi:predicted RecB family nuclease